MIIIYDFQIAIDDFFIIVMHLAHFFILRYSNYDSAMVNYDDEYPILLRLHFSVYTEYTQKNLVQVNNAEMQLDLCRKTC